MLKKPEWLRVSGVRNPNNEAVAGVLKALNLNTVCNEAACPNHMECFSRKTATFMILGTACTRNCRFCNVRNEPPNPIDVDEPKRIAKAISELGMRYVVITSVTRDDLPDGGAAHFADVIRTIRESSPKTAIEVLIPDFGGDITSLKTVADALPNVISHNMETMSAFYLTVRPQANYMRSLELLANIKKLNSAIHSKSGIMLGLGETEAQVYELFDDLRNVGCEVLTIGQYLAPTREHLPVVEYIEPHRFEEYGKIAREKGFSLVASAPLIRSSYHADEVMKC